MTGAAAFLLLAIVPPLLAGWMAASLALVPYEGRPLSHLLRFALAVCLALGITSLTGFLRYPLGLTRSTYMIVETIAMLAAAGALTGLRSRVRRHARSRRSDAPRSDPPRRLRAAFTLSLAFAVAGFVIVTLCLPHGWWDAWMNWDIRARFLYRGAEHWRDAFSPALTYSHPQYPVLLATTVSRLWTFAGRETQAVPVSVAFAFTFGTVALVVGTLAAIRGERLALLGGLVLLGSLYFIKHGAAQCADIPLGFFMLAAFASVALADRADRGARGLLLVAGLAAGFAVWSKDEGLLFAIAFVAVRSAVALRRNGARRWLRQASPTFAGVALVLLVIAYFKFGVVTAGPSSERFASAQILPKLLDPSRYVIIARGLLRGLAKLGNGMPLVLAVAGLLLGFELGGRRTGGLSSGFLILAIVLLGYLATYLVSPQGLNWIIGTTMDRLLVQLWPSAVFLFVLALRAPEEAGVCNQEGP